MSSASKPVIRPILQLRGVSFSYAGERFVEALDFAVGEAEFVGLLGANGSGKSTVLRLLGGMLGPRAGSVELWGKPLPSYRNRDRAKLMSYLPQTLDMGVPFRVRELAGMGLYPYETPTGMGVEEALQRVGLADRADAPLSRLSGGERRRAYLAMTLLQGAGILLLDEPLANLDIRYQMEILRLLRELRAERSISVVMALHDINLASGFERLALLKGGRIIADGSPEEVLTGSLLGEAFEVPLQTTRAGGRVFISVREE